MGVASWKKEAERLPNADTLLGQFREHWISPLRKNSNTRFPYLGTLSKRQKQDVNGHLANMDGLLKELAYMQIANEKIITLAYRNVELEVAKFSDDNKKIRRLIRLFLNDSHSCVENIVRDLNTVSIQLQMLQDSYRDVLKALRSELPKEDYTSFRKQKHNRLLKDLTTLHESQRKLAVKVGRSIVKQLKKMNASKKFRSFF